MPPAISRVDISNGALHVGRSAPTACKVTMLASPVCGTNGPLPVASPPPSQPHRGGRRQWGDNIRCTRLPTRPRWPRRRWSKNVCRDPGEIATTIPNPPRPRSHHPNSGATSSGLCWPHRPSHPCLRPAHCHSRLRCTPSPSTAQRRTSRLRAIQFGHRLCVTAKPTQCRKNRSWVVPSPIVCPTFQHCVVFLPE